MQSSTEILPLTIPIKHANILWMEKWNLIISKDNLGFIPIKHGRNKAYEVSRENARNIIRFDRKIIGRSVYLDFDDKILLFIVNKYCEDRIRWWVHHDWGIPGEKDQSKNETEVEAAVMDSEQAVSTTTDRPWYFTDQKGEIISNDQPIDHNTYYLTHPCPMCHEEGSKGRNLPWILYECLNSGKASFPCDSCGNWIKIPPEVFLRDLLETTKERLENYIGRTPDNIFVANWLKLVADATCGSPPACKDIRNEKVVNQQTSRFVDNDDGTITDTQTNLMWQKEDDGQKMTLREAEAYCKRLSLGGHENWRMPDIVELQSICSDWAKIFSCLRDDDPYWSSTVLENPYAKASESQKYAAKVMFSSGEVNQFFIVYKYYTRAVRDLQGCETRLLSIKRMYKRVKYSN